MNGERWAVNGERIIITHSSELNFYQQPNRTTVTSQSKKKYETDSFLQEFNSTLSSIIWNLKIFKFENSGKRKILFFLKTTNVSKINGEKEIFKNVIYWK